jgi:hypothetical protein
MMRVGSNRCAGMYVYTDSNANACPTGTTLPITTEAACRAAAAAAGKTYGGMGGGTVNLPTFPKGCFVLVSTGAVNFNDVPAGSALPSAVLLCIAITAPPTIAGFTYVPTSAPSCIGGLRH